MKIGIEVQRLFRKEKHGMEIVALELIKNLQHIDKSNEYVIFVKDDADNECIKESSNFKIVKVPGFSYADWEQIHLPRAVKKEKIDLLHCTCNTAPIMQHTPMLLTLHDIIYLETIQFSGTPYQNFGNLYRRIVVPRVIPKSKFVITVSNFEKENIIKRLKVDEEKIKVVHNASNSIFKICRDKFKLLEIANKYRLPEKFIMFLGNTAPKKNTRGVLQAYSYYVKNNVNPLPIVITDCSSEYIYKLLDEIQHGSLKEKIIIRNYIPFNDMPFIYNLATLFLYPSLRESFGMPIIESMACGTPVITSNTSSMPEVAGNAALLVNPKDPVNIASSIKNILSNTNLYNKKKEEGLQRSSEFSWKKCAEQVIDLYYALNHNNSYVKAPAI